MYFIFQNSNLIFNYPVSLNEEISENKTANNTSDSHPELNCTNKTLNFKQMFYVVSCQKEMVSASEFKNIFENFLYYVRKAVPSQKQ